MKLRSILILQVVIILVVGIGWTQDVIKLTRCDFKAPYKAEIIYTVGLIPPVGMITGWLNLGK